MQPRKSASPAPLILLSTETVKPHPKKPSHLRLVSYNDDNAVSDDGEDDDRQDDDDGNNQDSAANQNADMEVNQEVGSSKTQTNDDQSSKEAGADAAAAKRDKATEYGFQLPPEPKGKCPAELQDKITNMHAKMKQGMDMNRLIQDRKEFRNPSIYEKLIQFCDINELGTNYPPEIYDPLQWGKPTYICLFHKLTNFVCFFRQGILLRRAGARPETGNGKAGTRSQRQHED